MYSVIVKIFGGLAIFVVMASLSIMLLYISQMHSRMKSSNIENSKLLNGMHEGLLIVSKTTNEAMFCNYPAQKLLKGAIDKFEREKRAQSYQLGENRLLKYKFLNQTKIAIKG